MYENYCIIGSCYNANRYLENIDAKFTIILKRKVIINKWNINKYCTDKVRVLNKNSNLRVYEFGFSTGTPLY